MSNKYKEQMRSNWSGCRLLHEAVDPHRGRPAKYFAIPGEFALIGYSDDTDTFVIPVSDYIPRKALENLRAMQEGRAFTVTALATTRQRRIFHDDEASAPVAPTTTRRRSFNG